MIKNFFAVASLAAALVWLIGCTSVQPSTTQRVPAVLYYGADLSPFPPSVREWIMNQGYPRHNMEQAYMIDSQLRVWWGNDNNSVYAEASYIVAPGYGGAGS